MNTILNLREIKDLYLIISERDNIRYQDSILYISKDNIVEEYKKDIYPFRTSINNQIYIYPYKEQNYIKKEIKILEFIDKNKSINTLNKGLDLEKKDIGWLNINNNLKNIIGEIFLDRYIFNLYKNNLRKENIEKNNFIFLEVEEDIINKKKLNILSDIITEILQRLNILKIIVLKNGDIIYLLENNNYMYIIPNIYICFCKLEHIYKLIN